MMSCSRSGISTLGLTFPIGRPTSAGMILRTFSAMGVKRRMRRSLSTITMGILALPSRLFRSLFATLN